MNKYSLLGFFTIAKIVIQYLLLKISSLSYKKCTWFKYVICLKSSAIILKCNNGFGGVITRTWKWTIICPSAPMSRYFFQANTCTYLSRIEITNQLIMVLNLLEKVNVKQHFFHKKIVMPMPCRYWSQVQ